MANAIEVIGDLTLELDGDKVKVTNDTDGDLVILFSDKKVLGKFLKTRFSLNTGFNSLNRVNKLLLEQKQPVILRVNNEDWVILGHYDNPVIKYTKLAPLLLDNPLSDRTPWYIAAGAICGGFVAALIYTLVKRQN